MIQTANRLVRCMVHATDWRTRQRVSTPFELEEVPRWDPMEQARFALFAKFGHHEFADCHLEFPGK